MTALAPPLPPRFAVPVSVPPTEVHWTADEFLRLGDSGLLEGRRAMLIEGTILEEGPMNRRIGSAWSWRRSPSELPSAPDGGRADRCRS